LGWRYRREICMRIVAWRSAALAVAVTLVGCGGGTGGSSSRTASETQVAACARQAGLQVTTEKFDASFGETGQLGVSTTGNTITITFFTDASKAASYAQLQGGAKNPGAEPGGNEAIGTASLSFYAKDAALAKAEGCVKA
jgi:hypothetical protein